MNEPSTRKRTILLYTLGALAVLAAGLALLLPDRGQAPEAGMQASAENLTLADSSELLQTFSYTRCQHVVTRRTTAPVELYGQTMDEVAALYADWRITEFSPALVRMERQLDLFCPDHLVLMPNGAGYLCVFENKYGDAMALVNELTHSFNALPAAAQEEVSLGLGFSTAQELEQWLESVDS